MCLLRFAQTVKRKHVGRKLLKTVQTMTTFRNRLADPLRTRRGPPLVRGPQFENRCIRGRHDNSSIAYPFLFALDGQLESRQARVSVAVPSSVRLPSDGRLRRVGARSC